MTTYHTDYQRTAANIIARLGKNIVLAVPLGLGKPIGILNSFYQLACQDPSINLTIITGLTLSRPRYRHLLEERLVKPLLERVLKDYEDPLYEKARETQTLPDNITVIEFFLAPGKFLKNATVQQNYISSKYTNVVDDAFHYAINVFAQEITRSPNAQDEYNLSCNSDLFNATVTRLNKEHQRPFAIIGEVNLNLPFIPGDATVSATQLTDIIDNSSYKTLFSIPLDAISIQDHLIGFYTSLLIQDDGCLQIGIGQLANALANALIMREKHPDIYKQLFDELAVFEKFGSLVTQTQSCAQFSKGLYASTEMLSDEYLQLYRHGILKKRVYDHLPLQQLLSNHFLSETITPETLNILLQHQLIQPVLTTHDIDFLIYFGIFKDSLVYDGEYLHLPNQIKCIPDLTKPHHRELIIAHGLGEKLRHGKILHAAFFIGSADFYQTLREMPMPELQQFDMTAIARTNQLFWNPPLLRLQRQRARFVNSAMMITALGETIADGLTNHQEVSGVGGQFDFVNMARDLADAHSIINCRSTRRTAKGCVSNIVWQYPNITIPRYLRDIFITEYGIADCRSKTDSAVIQALLNITDSRFQPILLKQAKLAGKIPHDYTIPLEFQQNYPEKLNLIFEPLQRLGYFKAYPFGTDLTHEEQVLAHCLLFLQNCPRIKLGLLLIHALFSRQHAPNIELYLARMQLTNPKTIQEWLFKKLLNLTIAQQYPQLRLNLSLT